MRIVVLGAGQVGSTLAELLVAEDHDITVVDTDQERLMLLQSRIDVRTIPGHASLPSVLQQAGAAEADMLIAVTNSDEINMIACQVGYSLFRIPQKIARIRQTDYAMHPNLYQNDALPVDVLISPETQVALHLKQLVHHPEAQQVITLLDGQLRGVVLSVHPKAPFAGLTVQEALSHVPRNTLGLVLGHSLDTQILEPHTPLTPGMRLFLLTTPAFTQDIIAKFRPNTPAFEQVFLAGGGNIGKRLAESLQMAYQVKLIEHNKMRAHSLSAQLNKALVLHGDASDSNLLLHENIDRADAFFSITNSDETNIMTAMLAKHLGCKHTGALVNRQTYHHLIDKSMIDVMISPQKATISSILAHIRRGDVAQAQALYCGSSEILEVVIHGSARSSSLIGRRVHQITMPPGCTIAALQHGHQILLAPDQHEIQDHDRLLVVVTNKKSIPRMEALFQVKPTYL